MGSLGARWLTLSGAGLNASDLVHHWSDSLSDDGNVGPMAAVDGVVGFVREVGNHSVVP